MKFIHRRQLQLIFVPVNCRATSHPSASSRLISSRLALSAVLLSSSIDPQPGKGPLCIRNCQLLPFWQTSHQATACCQLSSVASFQLSSATLGSCMPPCGSSLTVPLPTCSSPCKYVGIINIFQSIDFWPLWMLSMLMMSDGQLRRHHQPHLMRVHSIAFHKTNSP